MSHRQYNLEQEIVFRRRFKKRSLHTYQQENTLDYLYQVSKPIKLRTFGCFNRLRTCTYIYKIMIRNYQ